MVATVAKPGVSAARSRTAAPFHRKAAGARTGGPPPSRPSPSRASLSRPSSTSRQDAPAKGPRTSEEVILFQTYFKSVGPRTYAAQVKQATNGNHALVITEGKRDPKTNEVIKHKTYVWSEDFPAFFKMLQDTVAWIRQHPVPEEVKKKRDLYWAKQISKENVPSAATKSRRGNLAAPRSQPAATPPARSTRPSR
jgi:hypothetical protein